MAKLGQLDYNEGEFDRNRQGYVPLPDGAYNVEIVSCEQKKWDDGGVQLGVTYKVTDGEHEGKTIFDNLQLVHKSPNVQGIARSALHKICENVEAPWPLNDDEQLVGGIQTIVLKSKPKDGKTYQNVVSREPLLVRAPQKRSAPRQQADAPAPAPNKAAASNSDVPW